MANPNEKQIEAGRILDEKTKEKFRKFNFDQQKKIGRLMGQIAREEVGKTRGRLQNRSFLASLVAKDSRGIIGKLKKGKASRQGSKNFDYGTIRFGALDGPVTVRKGRASEIDNLAALLAGGAKRGSPIQARTEKQAKRGFVFGNNHHTIRMVDWSYKLPLGHQTDPIPPDKEYLDKAEENIIEEMEARIPPEIERIWAKQKDL